MNRLQGTTLRVCIHILRSGRERIRFREIYEYKRRKYRFNSSIPLYPGRIDEINVNMMVNEGGEDSGSASFNGYRVG